MLGAALLATASMGFRLEHVLQTVRQCYGEKAVDTVKDWDHLLTQFQVESEQRKLTTINTNLNEKLRADSDLKIWGQEDYWATPIEARIKGIADCEDYAIPKYFSLKFSGVPVSKLRLTYVKALIEEEKKKSLQAHMVLTYYPSPDAEPLILDNIVNEILPASRRRDLVPIYSFNSEGVWKSGSHVPQANGLSGLSKWTNLIDKMKIEGFE